LNRLLEKIESLWAKPISKVIVALLAVWTLGGIGIYFLEGEVQPSFDNIINSLWWTIVTMTTVGYGDMSPSGLPGRIFAIIIMMSGIGLIALVTGTISSAFVTKKIREGKGLENINIEDHILICGWNRKMEHVINSLINLSKDKIDLVLVNEESPDKLNSFVQKFDLNIRFVIGDYSEESILQKANVKKARAAIILMDYKQGNDQKAIITTLGIKHLTNDCRTIVYANDKDSIRYLKRANADEIIFDDDFETFMAAAHILAPGIPEVINRILDYTSPNSLKSVKIPKSFVGKNFEEFFNYLRKKKKLICIGVFEIHHKMGVNEILSSDTSALDQFIEKKLKQAGHQFGNSDKTGVIINPGDDYIIKPNEEALVIE
jgi:voltage-gated potassium channel